MTTTNQSIEAMLFQSSMSTKPYPGNRLRAAWWVLTGRAHAVQWPKTGDIERVIETAGPPPTRRLAPSELRQLARIYNQAHA